jgi:polyisoprenoid-binding protein YceI
VRSAISAAIVLVLGPFGCPEPEPTNAKVEKPAAEAEKPAAPAIPEVSDNPEPIAAPKQSPTAPQQLTADVAHSTVKFLVSRATTGHVGHFEKFTGTLELTDGRPTKLEIAVKTGSVVADRQGLTSHLKSADFFDVDKFPTATFSAETITAVSGEDPNTYEIEGTMRLHGVRGKLEFPATIEVEPDRVVGRATLDISAKAFGIDYAGMEAELADDAVALEVELVFPR